MRLLVIDHHELFRQGVISLLGQQPDLLVVGEATGASEGVAKAIALDPDVVIIDVDFPDQTGLQAIRSITSRRTNIKVLVLTSTDSDEQFFTALENGARGYLLKNIAFASLVASIRALECGEAAITRSMTNRLLNHLASRPNGNCNDQPEFHSLTRREREVAQWISNNADNRQIARELYLSENTVKVHVHKILKKLKLRSRREIALHVNQFDPFPGEIG